MSASKPNFVRLNTLAIMLLVSVTLTLGLTNASGANKSAGKGKDKVANLKHMNANSGSWSANVEPEDKGTWTYNTETNVYKSANYQNVSAGYASTNGWSGSLSVLNTQFTGANNHFMGNTFANIAKEFDLNETFALTVGSMNGVALVNNSRQQWFNYNYLDAQYQITPAFMLHGGTYFANKPLTGTSSQVGYLLGSEITFIKDRLALQIDYTSGQQSLSGTAVHLLLDITPVYQVYMGVFVPDPQSGYEYTGIVGFNVTSHNT